MRLPLLLAAFLTALLLWVAALVHISLLYLGQDQPKRLQQQPAATAAAIDPTTWTEYWKYPPAPPASEYQPPALSSDPNLFVTFEDDAGGWNNIRMAFECFVLVAKLTGRTLVLPPRARFYLLDSGPIKLFDKPSMSSSSYDDFYDLDALRKQISIISTEEFIARFPITNAPRDATPIAGEWRANGKHTEWFYFLRQHADAIIWPSGPNDAGREGTPPEFLFENLPPNLLPTKRILHFPVHLSQGLRYLGGAPRLLAYAHPSIAQYGRNFLRQHLRYTPAIFNAARDAIVKLGGIGRFACMHVRRNDLQYGQSFLAAEQSLRNVRPRLRPSEPLYLATDEVAAGFFDVFEREGFTVRRLRDVMSQDHHGHLQSKHEGMVEQVICAHARVFVGTSASTFSSYIIRMHKYVYYTQQQEEKGEADLDCLFHDVPESVLKPNRACMYAPGFSALDSEFY